MKVEPGALGKAIKTVYHAAKGAGDPRHQFIWLETGPREQFIRVVATDNYRVAVARVAFDDKNDVNQYAIAIDDVTALLHFLARAVAPMKVLKLPDEAGETERMVFQDQFSALALPNYFATHSIPEWRKVEDQEWGKEVYMNLALVGEAATAAGEHGWVQFASDPKDHPVAFRTQDYTEYVMPLRKSTEPDRGEFRS